MIEFITGPYGTALVACAGLLLLIVTALAFVFFRNWKADQRDLVAARRALGERGTEVARLTERAQALHAGAEQARGRVRELSAVLDGERIAANRQTARIAKLHTEIEQSRLNHRDQLALLSGAREEMTARFTQLAGEILEDKSHRFTETNRANIGAVLDPLREQLRDFKRQVENTYDKESRDRVSLKSEIENLRQLNERISEDAVNLTHALTGDAKQRGTWGELKLERLLEEAGLNRGLEYDVQVSLTDADGQRFQPDVVIHLPEQKDVIVDSKVSLVAYERYYAADDDDTREQELRRHIAAIRQHVRDLSGKNYADLTGVNALDLVLMFVPIEPALMLALDQDRGLFSEAFERRIVLVGPSTMAATLRIIHNIWRTDRQNRNALEIARQAGALYDKFVAFNEDLDDIGRGLNKARATWRQAANRLRGGRGNLLSRVENLKTLGAKARKSLDRDALAEARDSTEPSLRLASDNTDAASDA